MIILFETWFFRLHLDPFGGILFGENLSKKRKWSWLDFAENHQHAPPLQPLAIALSNQVSLRIANQNAITLAYRSGPHSVKFNVGVKLKVRFFNTLQSKRVPSVLLFNYKLKVGLNLKIGRPFLRVLQFFASCLRNEKN